MPATSESGSASICRIGSDGQVRRVARMVQPNGLGFSPDERTFYASQTPANGEGAIFGFDVDAVSGGVSRRLGGGAALPFSRPGADPRRPAGSRPQPVTG